MMLRNLFVCIIILSCSYNVSSEILQRVSLSNGLARFSKQRNLDTLPNASLPIAMSPYYNSFAVKASFGEPYLQQQDIQSDSDFEIQIMISASQSGLNAPGGSCDVFKNKSYICQSPLCDENTSSPQNISYPFFSTLNATTLNLTPSNISIANEAWQLTASSPLYVHNCNTSGDYFLAGSAYGWIGLGLSEGSNFQSENPVFSFLISSSSGESELIFGFNSSYANASQPVVNLSSDPDWKLSASSLSFGPSFVSNYQSITPLIFDVQYHRIALPAAQYNDLMSYLQTFEYQGMTCDSTQQDCFFLGNLSVLPDLTFTLADGSILSLPPSAYMIQSDDSNYYTMFDSFDIQFAGENYTVIGTNVMSHYYTVFSNPSPSNYTISLYSLESSSTNNSGSNSKTNTPNDSRLPTWAIVIIIVGVIAVTSMVSLFCYVRYKKSKSKRQDSFIEKSAIDVELNQSHPGNL